MSTGVRLLILGGAGFIGSNFTRHAVERHHSVTVLDRLSYAGDPRNLDGITDDIEFVEGDIRDRELLGELYSDVDRVVNFAAQSHVDRSIEDGRVFVQHNVEGAFVAMDALRDHDVERFLQISTDEVYGSLETGEATETRSLDPSSPYSASKAAADLFVNAMWETYDLPITVVRPTNVYGPRQHPEKLIPKFALRAMAGKPLPLYGDGTNVRQWLFVDDLCTAFLAVLDVGTEEVFNVGGRVRKQNVEIARAILNLVGNDDAHIEFVEDRPGHDQRYALDDEKARDRFGFSAETPFEDGLAYTVEWYRDNRDRYLG